MQSTRRNARLIASLLVPAISFLAWLSLIVMTLLNPSATIDVSIAGTSVVGFAVATLLAALLVPALPGLALQRSVSLGRAPFKIGFAALHFSTLAALVLMSLRAGSVVHRDFYVYGTQIIMLYLSSSLLSLEELGLVGSRHSVYRALSAGAIVAFALWIGWLMMMSYAIVTRAEPRWIEATVYNLVNGVIGLVLLFSAALLWQRTKRRVFCRRGALYLDERNVSDLLSPQEAMIAHAFLVGPEAGLTCASLYRELHHGDEGPSGDVDCERCVREQWTAYQCPAYRNIKNRISDTKKYLELLQIGTIVPVSENPRNIKAFGWRLRLFDDVRKECGRPRKAPVIPHVRK